MSVWFADVGLPLSWLLMAGWLLLTVLTASLAPVRAALPRPVALLTGSGTCVVLLTAQAAVVDRVEDLGAPGTLDRSVLAWALTHRSHAAIAAMKAVSAVGSPSVMAVLAVLAAALLWRAHHRAVAVMVVIAAVGAGLLGEGFKHLYQRSSPLAINRPGAATSFSLPSGHALGSVVVLGALAAAAVMVVRGRRARIAAIVLATLTTAAVGFSRVYLGVHWVSDVLAGWLLGGAWLAVCVSALVLMTAPAARAADSAAGVLEECRDAADPPVVRR